MTICDNLFVCLQHIQARVLTFYTLHIISHNTEHLIRRLIMLNSTALQT